MSNRHRQKALHVDGDSKTAREYVPKSIKYIAAILLSIGMLFVTYMKYVAFRVYNPIVPSGDDAIVHFAYATHILKNGGWPHEIYYSYPPFFHILTAWISKITGYSILDILFGWTFILVPLVMLAIYIFCVKVFKNVWIALASAIVVGIFSNQPQQTISDGGLPNVLAADVFLPLGLAILFSGFEKRDLKRVGFSGLIFALIVTTHHISAVYCLLLSLILLLYFFVTDRPNWKFFVASIALIYIPPVLAGWLVWPAYRSLVMPLFLSTIQAIHPVTATVSKTGSTLSTATTNLVITDQPPVPVGDYGVYLGKYLIWLTIGAIAMISWPGARYRKEIFFVALWAVLFFVLSQNPATHYPARFARELAMPLSIIGGWLLVEVSRAFPYRLGIPVALYLVWLAQGTFVLNHDRGNIYPVPVISKNTETPAVRWLAENTEPGDKIVLGSTVGYLQYLEYFLPGRTFYLTSGQPTILIDMSNFEWKGHCRTAFGNVYYYERDKDSNGELTKNDTFRTSYQSKGEPNIRIFQRNTNSDNNVAKSCVRENLR